MNEWAVKKAKVLASPPIYIPNESRPRFLEVSSTGPGAGTRSVFLNLNGHRVIKEVGGKGEGAFTLEKIGPSYRILSPDGSVFAEDVQVERSIIHAPEQAFLNIEQRCIFNCAFCASSGIKNRTRLLSDEKVLAMLEDAVRKGARGIALTSGVWPDISGSVGRIARILSEFHDRHPEIPLGAEIYTENLNDLQLLKDAGVSEFKLNVETATKGLCEVLCPGKDFEAVHEVLGEAASVFGRGNVTSNIIYGLGESDDEVIAEAERFADMGVVPNLRALRLNDVNRGRLAGRTISPPGAERMTALSEALKAILVEKGLTTLRFRTMCHACGACDIQPFIDF